MDVFPVDWQAREKELSFEITCYAKLADRRAVTLHIPFFPFFFVECPPSWSQSRAAVYVAECVTKLGCMHKYSLPVTRKTIWGFTNAEPRQFVQLAFPTLAASRKARRSIRMQTFEGSVDQVLRLFHVRNIRPAQWLHVNTFVATPDEARETTADLEGSTTFLDLSPSVVRTIPPIVFASWDIECYSASGKFPLADNPPDVICTIGTTFQRYGDQEPYLRHAVTLGGCDPVPGLVIEARDTEAEVLNTWIELVGTQQTDVLVGWNTYG